MDFFGSCKQCQTVADSTNNGKRHTVTISIEFAYNNNGDKNKANETIELRGIQ